MTDSPRKVAVVIAIDKYRPGIPRLLNAVRDARAVAEVLTTGHGYDVQLILDEEATLAALRARLGSLDGKWGAEARFILYFAGHGIAEDRDDVGKGPQGFLVPQDARREDTSTFLPMAEVQKALARLACRQVLVVLDCCFAGAFRYSSTRTIGPRPATLYRERYERYLREPAWQVLTSAAADERALDTIAGGALGSRGKDEDGSPFAVALCQGLRGAADLRLGGHPGDGVILASELHLYLEGFFERLEQQHGRPVQRPLLWSLGAGRGDQGQFMFFVPGREPALPSALELSEANNPYLGLRPFEAKDQATFFGRKAATDSLCERVKHQPLTLVVGPSGSGKSSLVRAGLFPRLRDETNPRWQLLEPLRPGPDPLAVLAQTAGRLQPGCSVLSDAVAAWRRDNAQTPLLLVLDQAEELVTLSPASCAAVQRELRKASEVGGGQLHIVLTLRSEFEPHFGEILPVASESGASGKSSSDSARFLIPSLTRAELREVVEGPASERVLYFEPPELVDQLLDEVSDMPGALPLLSFVLSEMYRAYVRQARADRTLRQQDYRALGGVAGALAQRADALYEGCASEALKASFRNLMLRMVVPGELTRRRVMASELEFRDPDEQARIQGIREQLLTARLIVSDRDGHGCEFIEPAHDKLIMGWPRLGRFLAEDREHVLHFGLTADAQEWEASHRHGARLWDRDARLPQAMGLQRTSPLRLNRSEADFVTVSVRRRRLGWLLAASLLGTALVLLLVWLVRERRHSKDLLEKQDELLRKQEEIQAESRRATQASLSERAVRAETLLAIPGRETEARVLAVLAYADSRRAGFTSHPAVEKALVTAAVGGAMRLHLEHPPVALTAAMFSPDGKRILTLGPASALRVFDAENGRLLHRLADNATRAKFSADGRLVTNSGRLWDVGGGTCTWIKGAQGVEPERTYVAPDGSRLVTFDDFEGALRATLFDAAGTRPPQRRILTRDSESASVAGFSPDGRSVFVSPTGTGRLLLFSATADRPARQIGNVHQALREVAISPDGKWLLTGSENSEASLFPVSTGSPVRPLKGPLFAVDHVAFSSDSKLFFTVGGRLTKNTESRHGQREGAQDVRLWDTDDASSDPDWIRVASQHRGSGAAAFSKSGELIAVTSSRDSIQIRRTSDLEIVTTLRGYALAKEESDEVRLLFAPDQQSLLSYSVANSGLSGEDPKVFVWDVTPRARPTTSDAALRILCRLLRYRSDWHDARWQSVRDACVDAVSDLPDSAPSNSPTADGITTDKVPADLAPYLGPRHQFE